MRKQEFSEPRHTYLQKWRLKGEGGRDHQTGSPFKKPPKFFCLPNNLLFLRLRLKWGRVEGLQRGMNLRFLCPQEGCPKRGEPPFPLRDLRSLLIPSTSEEAIRRISHALPRRLPAALYLHAPLTFSPRPGRNQSSHPRPSPQPQRLGTSALDVRASAKPCPRAAAGSAPKMTSLQSANGVRPGSAAALQSRGGAGKTLSADAILFPRLRLQASGIGVSDGLLGGCLRTSARMPFIIPSP